VLRDQLGKRLADEAGVDFDSELPEPAAIKLARGAANPALRASKPGAEPARQRKAMADRTERFRFTDRPDRPHELRPEDAPMRKDRPGSRNPRRPPRPERIDDAPAGPPRRVFHDDGSETEFTPKLYGKKPKRDAAPTGDKPPFKKSFGDKPRGDFADRPKRAYGDKPKGDFGDRPKRPYSPRPADGADRPKRDFGSRQSSPARSAGEGGHAQRGGGSGRTRDFGDGPKRSYASRPDSTDRPKRAYAPRPDAADRPKRTYAPRADAADRPKRAYAPRGDGADRPKRSFGDKPRAPRPAGDKPFTKRPRGSGPGGDRPRRPRPPKA